MRAVHGRAVLDHALVHHAAHQGVHAELVGLAEPDLRGQVVVALAHGVVLLVGAVAVGLGDRADGRGELVGEEVLHDGDVGQLEHLLAEAVEPGELPGQVTEGDVVFGKLALGVCATRSVSECG